MILTFCVLLMYAVHPCQISPWCREYFRKKGLGEVVGAVEVAVADGFHDVV